jgi:hypothetical protein
MSDLRRKEFPLFLSTRWNYSSKKGFLEKSQDIYLKNAEKKIRVFV